MKNNISLAEISFLTDKIQKSETFLNHFKQLLDSVPDPIFMKDKDLKWIYANKVILNLYNIHKDKYIGKTDFELLDTEYAQICFNSDSLTISQKTQTITEEKVIRDNGQENYYEVIKVPFYNKNGDFDGLIGIGRDITKTKQATFQLQEALTFQQTINQQAKMIALGEMLENIVHQWKQPLSSISTIASGVRIQIDYDILDIQELKNDMNNILHGVKYMSETIDDFRNFFKEDKSKNMFFLSEIIPNVLQLINGYIKRFDINLIQNIDSEVEIFGNKNELVQVLLNLINNAKDALVQNSISDKTIIISAYKKANQTIITIQDNGGGIPENIIRKIFDYHFTTKENNNGSGIGLYMSRIIIENSFNGKINCSNTNDGAKFEIII